MSGLKGDFISFTFNGVHSSTLGITRTSNGSRYDDNLLPTIQDKTVQIPGADGTYFFDSFYTQKPFSVPIAFDGLTEKEFQRLRRHFGDKGIHELIFDERPYKVYMAKTTGTPQLKTICFEEDGQRIYKGEGTLTFTAYYPFARSRFKFREDYTSENIPEWVDWPTVEGRVGNLEEWIESSGIIEQGNYDKRNQNGISLYNPGDMETDFKAFVNIFINKTLKSVSVKTDTATLGILNFKGDWVQKGEDTFICINSKNNLIEGFKLEDDQFIPTGNLYNDQIVSGDFFKIPLTEFDAEGNPKELIFQADGAIVYQIDYDYLYY